jgi:hypothetical protein
MKTRDPPFIGGNAGFARFFDIVNGFLIDAVAHGFDLYDRSFATLTDVYLAEIIVRTDAAG